MLNVEKVKYWHEHDIWTKKMVVDAVKKGKLTEENYKEITGEEYIAE